MECARTMMLNVNVIRTMDRYKGIDVDRTRSVGPGEKGGGCRQPDEMVAAGDGL